MVDPARLTSIVRLMRGTAIRGVREVTIISRSRSGNAAHNLVLKMVLRFPNLGETRELCILLDEI